MKRKDKLVLLFVLFIVVFSSLACEDTGGRITVQDYQNNAVQAVQNDAAKVGRDLEATYSTHVAPAVREVVYEAICAGCND